jgi:hypothetical protein
MKSATTEPHFVQQMLPLDLSGPWDIENEKPDNELRTSREDVGTLLSGPCLSTNHTETSVRNLTASHRSLAYASDCDFGNLSRGWSFTGSIFDRCSIDRTGGRRAASYQATPRTNVWPSLHAIRRIIAAEVDRNHFFSEIQIQERVVFDQSLLIQLSG